jgi:hypothetical protein
VNGAVEYLWKHLATCNYFEDGEIKQTAKIKAETYNAKRRKMRESSEKENPTHNYQVIQSNIRPVTPPCTSSNNGTYLRLSPQANHLYSTSFAIPASGISQPNGLLPNTNVHDPVQPWTQQQQEDFKVALCRLLVTCNIAWAAVSNPYWIWFFNTYIPQAHVPSPQQLAGRVLDEESQKVLESWRIKTEGRFGSGQCDGWKNIRKRNIVASVMNVEFMVSPHDVHY